VNLISDLYVVTEMVERLKYSVGLTPRSSASYWTAWAYRFLAQKMGCDFVLW